MSVTYIGQRLTISFRVELDSEERVRSKESIHDTRVLDIDLTTLYRKKVTSWNTVQSILVIGSSKNHDGDAVADVG